MDDTVHKSKRSVGSLYMTLNENDPSQVDKMVSTNNLFYHPHSTRYYPPLFSSLHYIVVCRILDIGISEKIRNLFRYRDDCIDATFIMWYVVVDC